MLRAQRFEKTPAYVTRLMSYKNLDATKLLFLHQDTL